MRYFSKKKISLLFSIIFLISVYLIIFSNDFPETPILPPLYSRRVLQNSTSDAQKYYNSSIHTVKLLGNIDIGYYYVNIFVGSPPQKQTVIVDTGSSLTAIPCSGNKKKERKILSIFF